MTENWMMTDVFKQIEVYLETEFPVLKQGRAKWSWRVERILSNHILIHFDAEMVKLEDRYLLVWSRDGTVWKLDSWEKARKLIEDERLSPTDELVIRLKHTLPKT
jgi:hypothetical protein